MHILLNKGANLMMLVIDTQYKENYGAHDWDGEGECPQYWKFKGGSEYKVLNVPEGVDPAAVVRMLGQEVMWKDNYSESYVLGVRFEDDGYLSQFEQSQMEYDGEIQFAEPEVEYGMLMAVEAREYAERAAELDAVYYGA
jgi:hypothetical protein